MPSKTFIRSALAALGAGAALAVTVTALPAHAGADDGWQSAGKGKTSGISGIAVAGGGNLEDGVDAVIVRDNKDADENRIASVTYEDGKKPDVDALDWKGGELPSDLEALDDVPGEKGGYLAVASSGAAYHLKVADGVAEVVDTFTLPAVESGDEVENFALGAPPSSAAPGRTKASAREGKLVAVWGGRGEDDRPATLHAAPVSFDSAGESHFGDVESAQVTSPYPTEHVRHASDTKLTDSGALQVSSASDPGDDGPFDSAVYTAGHVTLTGSGGVKLSVTKDPEALKKFDKHKIEALACLPGSDKAVLGTDDENGGGSLTTADGLCGG
ncbi:hypothetical protein G4Z16_02550 [Streptomyces bathyalis]|uniref:Secreted protein n=1 Tax=Streptomyces bathyalis TaxID=2710756 RepID=A0A7T1T2Z9_9ACTN|nr:hypothetical protein [Streptomyces bathyalis]QPP05459.1 hypothetical protein G4Z16_02550 [Streptomyces bathyalis]